MLIQISHMLLLLFTKCYPSLAYSNEFLIVKWWYGFLLTLKSYPSWYICYKSIPFSSWSPEAYLLLWKLIIWLVWNKTICYFAFRFLPFCGNLNYNFSFTYSNSLIRFLSLFLPGNPLCIRNYILDSVMLILFICKHISIYYSLKKCSYFAESHLLS